MRAIGDRDSVISPSGVLSEYVQDPKVLQNDFNNLAKLAAKTTGMQTCLINLVDIDLQWTIGSYGSPLQQLSSEESVCQYTILQNIPFEVKDLSQDKRFACMKQIRESGLRYYYGIPLRSPRGLKIGALCILDRTETGLPEFKKELLQLMAAEVARRLEDVQKMNKLRQRLSEAERLKWVLAHDIRGPLNGINSLSELALEELHDNRNTEIPDFLSHIVQSGRSLLALTDQILANQSNSSTPEIGPKDLGELKEQIVRLFMPALLNKQLAFTFMVAPEAEKIPLPVSGFLQAISNLVANAIKFTPEGGRIAVQVITKPVNEVDHLHFTITDNGIGVDETTRQNILSGKGISSPGTAGEQGCGLGLIMVRKLVKACKGQLSIHSVPGLGTSFILAIPT